MNSITRFSYICNRDRKKVKQNFYDRDLSNVNNNVPNGVWDDNDVSVFYPDLQEMDDYQPYQPCTLKNIFFPLNFTDC